jgi:hypothetical protein
VLGDKANQRCSDHRQDGLSIEIDHESLRSIPGPDHNTLIRPPQHRSLSICASVPAQGPAQRPSKPRARQPPRSITSMPRNSRVRPRRRPIGRFSNPYRAGVALSAVGAEAPVLPSLFNSCDIAGPPSPLPPRCLCLSSGNPSMRS